ncbi:MBOAT family O-acyltransferase [Sedimenticola selenatireducens]|uniref:MBOAT family O-acyltransferase n=1 Tax=Sedimenticola selenatireducens TaxID=191960 RepID=UPI002AAA7A91|nr:MBOAT family O-acyltransferase [Sedimenticola selenatireducens]
MTFTSLTWLALIVGVTGIYWLLPAPWRNGFLALVSFVFLASIQLTSALFLVAFTLISYLIVRKDRVSKAMITVSVGLVIAVVAYYKMRVAHSPVEVLRDVAMPIGMSYYAFRVVHYVIDKYRDVLPTHGFYDYVCYLFFVPTMLVGPIHRFTAFHNNHIAIRWNASELSEGIERILLGYFKIIVLGNFLFNKYLANQIAQLDPSNQSLIYYLEAVRGSLNLYVQFSGYSDIAIGFALMLGYRVMENFNNPFMKTNIAEFWRSWHISLTSWSRDYIYMTMVGLTRNPYLGTLVSLLVVGIWHELSLRYVIWGLYHGLGIIFVNKLQQYVRRRNRERGLKGKKHPDPLLVKVLKIFATANYFFFGYIIISQESFADTLQIYRIIFIGWIGGN